MIEVTGDLWTYPADWRVITTNGFVKKNGECVMGRGCAKEFANLNPTFPRELGNMITRCGNHVYPWIAEKLITFPVKHNWWEKADPKLIEKSVEQLQKLLFGQFDETEIVMPRPGCGNGQLKWEDVKPLLADLPDNVKVITWAPKPQSLAKFASGLGLDDEEEDANEA